MGQIWIDTSSEKSVVAKQQMQESPGKCKLIRIAVIKNNVLESLLYSIDGNAD